MMRLVLRVLTLGLLGRVEAKCRIHSMRESDREAAELARRESAARGAEACQRVSAASKGLKLVADETVALNLKSREMLAVMHDGS